MAIEEKTYLLFNHSPSKVVVGLRDNTVVIDGASDGVPSSFPFTLSELQYINNKCQILKNGTLRPAEEQEEYIYNTLRIPNWTNILTNEQVEDYILHPSVERIESLLNIKDTAYYNRVYGIFISLRNANAPITANVARIIVGRHHELRDGKRDTEFSVRPKDTQSKDSTGDIAQLKAKLEALEKILASQEVVNEVSVEPKTASEEPKKKISKTPTRTKTPKRTTTKKE